MRNSWFTSMLLALLLAGCSQPQRLEVKAAPAPTAPSPIAAAIPADNIVDAPEVRKALQQLDIWLEGRRLKDDLTSISVGVVHDQQLIWSKGYGYADVVRKIPATDRTLYRVASITKLFTSTAVMQQVEQGRLSLEDPVNQHLKWFTPERADPSHPVRVWHLLTHTSGLQRETPGMDWDQLRGATPEAVKAATVQTPLKFPPQVRQKYSNYAFEVAGQLVTEVSGMPYQQYMQERVFRPLGMSDTHLLDGHETAPGLAVPYGRRGEDGIRPVEQQARKNGLLAAGSLVTSVRDLAKFASLQFRTADDFTGPVLSGRSLRDMHRPRWLAPDWSRGNGIGWFLNRRDKSILLSHGGALPGYKSRIMVDPANKVAVIVLSNSEDADVGAIADGAVRLVADTIGKAAKPDEPPAAADPDLGRFEGLYRDRWGEYSRVALLAGKLCVIALESDDIELATTTLERLGPTTFRTHVSQLRMSGDVEDVIEFILDPTGRVVSFTTESGAYRFFRVE